MREPGMIERAAEMAERVAVADSRGVWSYGDLLDRSSALAGRLLDGRHDLRESRVILLAEPGIDYVSALWAIWRAGALAVPVSPLQPPAEWAYVAADSRASAAIVSTAYRERLAPVAVASSMRLLACEGPARAGRAAHRPDVDPARGALILYTSGTTSAPKGVVLTHANIQAQVECLVHAWGWVPDDRILHVLPLHHTHGVINALACPLWAGAACEMTPGFDVARTWSRLASGDISVFMAVPAIYQRLLAAYDTADPDTRRAWATGARGLRLAVSGSAALPGPIFDRWRELAGQPLLERYGMTEIGMALSNPLDGDRRRGEVGWPLPGVQVRLVNESGTDAAAGERGELLVRGAGVFSRYWNRPDVTAAAFAADGWFRTGDVAVRGEHGYAILGRLSVDIIKTGGEKVSALEVEEALRGHPVILDCAVVGVPDDRWGECVAAAVVIRPGSTLTIETLHDWARAALAAWKIPKRLAVLPELPRNAMGKVSKPLIVQAFTR